MNPAVAPVLGAPGGTGRGREGEHDLQGDAGRAHVGEDRVLEGEQHHPDRDDADDRAPQQGDDHPPRSASGLYSTTRTNWSRSSWASSSTSSSTPPVLDPGISLTTTPTGMSGGARLARPPVV